METDYSFLIMAVIMVVIFYYGIKLIKALIDYLNRH